MSEEDLPEVQDLEIAAERRMQQADANPDDRVSEAAGQRLTALANDVRSLAGSRLMQEFHAIQGWLDEFGGTEDFQQFAHEYRWQIGIACEPEDGEAYLRALIGLARQACGAP
jgi:hypothetical protein